MTKEYFLVTVKVESFLASKFTQMVVISESVMDLLIRAMPIDDEFASTIMILCIHQITQDEYIKLRHKNPTNEDYLKLLREDYSEYIGEEEEYDT